MEVVNQLYHNVKSNVPKNMRVGVFSGEMTKENLDIVYNKLLELFYTKDNSNKFYLAMIYDEPDDKKLRIKCNENYVDNYDTLNELYRKRGEMLARKEDTTEIDKLIDKEWKV